MGSKLLMLNAMRHSICAITKLLFMEFLIVVAEVVEPFVRCALQNQSACDFSSILQTVDLDVRKPRVGQLLSLLYWCYVIRYCSEIVCAIVKHEVMVLPAHPSESFPRVLVGQSH